MIILNLYDFVNSFESVHFIPESNRPDYICMKSGDSDPKLNDWTILKLTYHGPVSNSVINIQKKTGSPNGRERLFTELEKPTRNGARP